MAPRGLSQKGETLCSWANSLEDRVGVSDQFLMMHIIAFTTHILNHGVHVHYTLVKGPLALTQAACLTATSEYSARDDAHQNFDRMLIVFIVAREAAWERRRCTIQPTPLQPTTPATLFVA